MVKSTVTHDVAILSLFLIKVTSFLSKKKKKKNTQSECFSELLSDFEGIYNEYKIHNGAISMTFCF